MRITAWRLALALGSITLTVLILGSLSPFLKTRFSPFLNRPLRDQGPKEFKNVIVHHYADGMRLEDRCKAHGWALADRASRNQNLIYDALILKGEDDQQELDMLEIRIRELWDVVEKFVLVESDTDLMGKERNEGFRKSRASRFGFAESKIIYRSVSLDPLPVGEGLLWKEEKLRVAMTELLIDARVQWLDRVIMSQVDEIPNVRVLMLIKACRGYPSGMHLQLNRYLYSFEFFAGADYWLPSVHIWSPGYSAYKLERSSDTILTDAGWHCTWCYRTIAQFQSKMKLLQGHSSRPKSILDPEKIQRVICEGKDVIGMYTEPITRLRTAVNLPLLVLLEADRYQHLRPGGCLRST